MPRYWIGKLRTLGLPLLLSSLALMLACGTAATPTPTSGPPATPDTAGTAVPSAEPTATTAPAQPADSQGTPKVNKLIMGLGTPGWETNLVWAGSVDHHSQHDLVMEALVDIDPETNLWAPELAHKWEMSPDGRAWTFWLNKGVQFHDDWGEFTAKDVAHSVAMVQRDDSLLAFNSAFQEIDRVEVIDDYQVVLHLKSPDPDYLFYVAPSGGMLMQSKALWDAKGLDGYQEKIIGTGPYLYQGRVLGQSISYERLPQHWRLNPVPDWPEFEIRWLPEDATRQAALLTGEIHVTELPRSLTDDAVGRGMKLIANTSPT